MKTLLIILLVALLTACGSSRPAGCWNKSENFFHHYNKKRPYAG